MPPARTIIRRSNYNHLSVTNLDTTHGRDLQKPYINNNASKPKANFGASKEQSWKSTNNIEERNYMDLDEFLQKSDSSSESDSCNNNRKDSDYPKPSVDLLASLLTLGKMIQNQKQLIQNQSSQVTSTYTETPTMALQLVNPEDNLIPTNSKKDKMCIDKLPDSIVIDETLNKCYDVDSKDSSLSSIKRPVIPEEIKDFDYWDRRKRNNLAAKKSREERRKKELEVVEMTKQLEIENSQLTLMLKRLTARNEWLESRVQDIRRCSNQGSLAESSSLSSEDG